MTGTYEQEAKSTLSWVRREEGEGKDIHYYLLKNVLSDMKAF